MSLTGGTLTYSYETFLQKSLNLFDLPNTTTARANLGVKGITEMSNLVMSTGLVASANYNTNNDRTLAVDVSMIGAANKVAQLNASGNLALSTTISTYASFGIGTETPSCSLQFNNFLGNKTLSFYDASAETAATAVNFFGMGVNAGTFRHQVPYLSTHSFYSGSNLVTSFSQTNGLVTNDGATFGGARSSTGSVVVRLQTTTAGTNDYAEINRASGTSGILTIANTGSGGMTLSSTGGASITTNSTFNATATGATISCPASGDITLSTLSGSLKLVSGGTLQIQNTDVEYGKTLTVYGRQRVYYDNTYPNQGGALVIGDTDGLVAPYTSPVLLAMTQSTLGAGSNVSMQIGKSSSNTAFMSYTQNTNTANNFLSLNHYGTANGIAIKKNGNVGIGTTNPTTNLHVVGDTSMIGKLGIGTTNPTTNLHVVGDTSMIGKLGIGTTTPTTSLYVLGDTSITGYVLDSTATCPRKVYTYKFTYTLGNNLELWFLNHCFSGRLSVMVRDLSNTTNPPNVYKTEIVGGTIYNTTPTANIHSYNSFTSNNSTYSLINSVTYSPTKIILSLSSTSGSGSSVSVYLETFGENTGYTMGLDIIVFNGNIIYTPGY